MHALHQTLIVLHFFGLALGFAASIANLVMFGLIARAAPADQAVLRRFPPKMAPLAEIGVALLWITGLALVLGKWGGFATMPGLFHAKLTAAAVLVAVLVWLRRLRGRAAAGDKQAGARIPMGVRAAALLASTALVLAVLSFK